MQTAIMQDLLPHLKQQFALLSQADAHAVGGVSMGGYGALRLVLAEPQQFPDRRGFVACSLAAGT